MQGKVEICGINTAKLEVLKNDEMTELLRRTKQGDMDARERLIRGNLEGWRAVGAPAVHQQGGEHGRPVPGGVHRPDQGHRQL